MDKESEKILSNLYNKLYLNIEKNKKKVNKNSIIISFLLINSNERYRLLNESSISLDNIPMHITTDLRTKHFIRNTDKLNNYTITANGIWEVENKNNIINESILIKYLDDKFFNVYGVSDKPLSDKEKVILFSMIAARAFSEESSVDLNKDETVRNSWKDIMDKSYEKLNSLHLISKLDRISFYGKPGNEHPVSGVFRSNEDIPKKTKGLFKAAGNRKYFLDICQESKISKENLKYLFRLIFGDKVLSIPDINEIDAFCRDIANSKNIYIFDPREHIFSKPEYDEVIRDTLLFE